MLQFKGTVLQLEASVHYCLQILNTTGMYKKTSVNMPETKLISTYLAVLKFLNKGRRTTAKPKSTILQLSTVNAPNTINTRCTESEVRGELHDATAQAFWDIASSH
jgi:hypothetical protein